MAKTLAMLDYTFMFEPEVSTWQRGFDFERDLADFFSAHGFSADLVDVTGGSPRRIFVISRLDKLDEMRKDTSSKLQNSPKIALDAAMKKATGVVKNGKP